MSYQTHDLAEWARFLSFGIGFTATGWLLWLLLFEPLLGCDLDPRPLAVRAGDRLLVETVNARYAARDALVALAILLAPTSAPQKGALR